MPKSWTFVVEGRGSFPMDMLRYDRCSPYEQEDVVWMEGTAQRSAKMVSHVGAPTPERWQSYGWTVDMVKQHKT